MSKNRKQFKASPLKKEEKEKQTPSKSITRLVITNIITLIAGLVILNIYAKRTEIAWLQEMLKSNYETIKQYPDATIDQRLGMKLGFNYAYLKHVKDNTPEDAVILFPPREIILKQPTQFTTAEFSPIWIHSFIYPRKVIMDGTEITTPITHVAVMNGWGYDKLAYQVENKHENAIYPINYPSN